MTTAGALKSWATRRANGWVHPRSRRPIAAPDAGRLADYPKCQDGHLFYLLRAEQRILETHANNPARAGFARGIEGSGVGFIGCVRGGTFAGGRATLLAKHAARRLHRIECELEARCFDRDTIDAHRFGEIEEQTHREGMMLDIGNTDFDSDHYEASAVSA